MKSKNAGHLGSLIIAICSCGDNSGSQATDAPPRPQGRFLTFERGTGILLSAPHGTADQNTGELAVEIAESLSWNCVVAEGFRTVATPVNVNRPTEKYLVPPDQEVHTEEARQVFEGFIAALQKASPRSPELYIEIHGNQVKETARFVEVASNGLSQEANEKVKQILTAGLTTPLGGFSIKMEGIDSLLFSAQSTKNWGTLSRYSPAIHIELPRKMRIELYNETLSFLKEALPQIAESLKNLSAQESLTRGHFTDNK